MKAEGEAGTLRLMALPIFVICIACPAISPARMCYSAAGAAVAYLLCRACSSLQKTHIVTDCSLPTRTALQHLRGRLAASRELEKPMSIPHLLRKVRVP